VSNVLNNAFSFGSPSIDNGVAVANQVTMTLSPDGDGINDQATIRFNPSDSNLTGMWHFQRQLPGFLFTNVGIQQPVKQSGLGWP